MVRDANNGVTAVFDSYGRLRSRLDLNQIGVLDSPLPTALPPTFYERARDAVFWTMLLALLAVSAIISRFDRRAPR